MTATLLVLVHGRLGGREVSLSWGLVGWEERGRLTWGPQAEGSVGDSEKDAVIYTPAEEELE